MNKKVKKALIELRKIRKEMNEKTIDELVKDMKNDRKE